MTAAARLRTLGLGTVVAAALTAAAPGVASAATPGPAAPGSTAPGSTAPGSAAPAKPAPCGGRELPAVVLGSPRVQAHAPQGYYLWHDARGYSLRATHPGTAKVTFTGTITTSAGIGAVHPVRLEKGDRVVVRGHSLTFRFTNVGGIDGMTFTADCSRTVRLDLRVNGRSASTEQVYLGAKRAHPTSNPFTVERGAEPAPTATATSPA